MPTYTFINKVTGESKNDIMTIANMEQYVKDNPDWYVAIMPINAKDNFVASRYTNIPIDGEYRSLLDSMKANIHDNTIDY